MSTPGAAVPDRGPPLEAVGITIITLCIISVLLRLWSRLLATQEGLWWDDWVAFAALPITVAIPAITIWMINHGFGKHFPDAIAESGLTPAQLMLIPTYVQDFFYFWGEFLIKTSALLFYARVFRRVDSFRTALWVVQVINVLAIIAFTLVAIFPCVPVQAFWYPQDYPNARCIEINNFWIGAAAIHAFLDFVILLMPMPMLWNIQISLTRKWGLIGVFGLGYSVALLSIVRLVTIWHLGIYHNQDPTWNYVLSMYFVMIEVPIGLISICLPSWLNLIKHAKRHGTTALFTNKATNNGSNARSGIALSNVNGNTANGSVLGNERGWQKLERKSDMLTTSHAVGNAGDYDGSDEQIHMRKDIYVDSC